MKTTLAILLAAALTARADLSITYEITQGEQPPSALSLKMKDGKIRTDVSKEVSAIVDITTGDTISLMHGQKMAMKLPGAMVKAAAGQAAANATAMGNPAFQPTGRTERIAGFACEEHVLEANGQRMEMWVTKEIPDGAKLAREMATASGGNTAIPGLEAGTPDGFPIRTKVSGPGVPSTVMTVVAFNRDEIDASEFQIPQGYREVEMPAIPGGN